MIRVVVVLVVGALLFAGGAQASMQGGDSVIFFNLGYATGKSAISGDNVSGGLAMLEFQKRDFGGPISGGLSIGYGELHESVAGDSLRVDYSLRTVPLMIGGRYWLGEGRLQGNVGIAFGMYFSRLTRSRVPTTSTTIEGATYTDDAAADFGLSIPVARDVQY